MDLQQLRQAASACTWCDLHKGRLNPVFDKGNPQSKVMICGMVPADEENKAGLPFVGRAGQLLDRILSEIDWSLDDVYITNLVKCYLKAGLSLEQDWIDNCLPYLISQIGILQPKVIVALGKDAAFTLLGLENKLTLGRVRGQVFDYLGNIKIIPTYHPSYLLRGGGEGHRSYHDVVADFLLAQEICLTNGYGYT
jgi:uracil-DNA glycosylase family 4